MGPRPGSDAERPGDLVHWDDLQYFLELARRRTLARASRRLGVSHTTVLRRVGSLERRLDQKLFDRSHVGFTLTERGRELLDHAEAMERAADGIFEAGRDRGRLAGPVRIAAVEGLAVRVIVPAMPRFNACYPDISLEISTVMQLANLTRREADISVSLALPAGNRLSAERVATCGVHLYASREYLSRSGTPQGVRDLERHLFVDYVEDMIEIQALRWLTDVVGRDRVVFRSTSPLAQLAAVENGVGIGMFPEYLARGNADLVRVLPDEVHAEREFWLAVHADLLRVPRMHAVYEFLTDQLESDLTLRGAEPSPEDHDHEC
jgi:DNA-binding transcriptional LysR family regulator